MKLKSFLDVRDFKYTFFNLSNYQMSYDLQEVAIVTVMQNIIVYIFQINRLNADFLTTVGNNRYRLTLKFYILFR